MKQFPLWLIPFLPLIGFLINGLLGRFVKRAGGWIAVACMLAAGLVSFSLLVSATAHDFVGYENHLWTWIGLEGISIPVGLRYDRLTAIMCFVITSVGSLVFLYATGYMKGDPGFNRFFAWLCLFAFSMLILVLGDSFPLMFVGWEGVGLCSYLLIGYYLDMPGAPDAGKKAFIVNRVGDAGFLIAMFLLAKEFGTLDIDHVVRLAPERLAYGGTLVTLATLAMFLGCTGKSAQIPLFVWLPDAMAGPTPVSALIHAATMVTAGVYLVVRCSTLFALAPFTLAVMAVIGALTAFVAGTIALTQRDIKKVLAYSTVSQLGYMFLACGCGAFAAGMFHVFTHAFFKACLFLGAGAVIHAIGGRQDLLVMGGLRKHLPIVAGTFLASCLAIAGFPLTSGFFSKDEILWATFEAQPILYPAALLTAFMTAIYSFRCYFLAFEGESRLPHEVEHHIHAPNWAMHLTLVALGAGALVVGFLNVPHFIAHSLGMGEGAAFHHFLHPVIHEAEAILAAHAGEPMAHKTAWEWGLLVLSVCVGLAGIATAARVFLLGWPDMPTLLARRFSWAWQISSGRWWWDDAYYFLFGGGTTIAARLSVLFDRWIIDGLLHGVGRVTREIGRGVRRLQSGQTAFYAVGALLGANILLLAILLW